MKKYNVKTGKFDLKRKKEKKSLLLCSLNSNFNKYKTQQNFFSPNKNTSNKISLSINKTTKSHIKRKKLAISLNSIDSFQKSPTLTKVSKKNFYSHENKNNNSKKIFSNEEINNFLLETDFNKKLKFKNKIKISSNPIQIKNYRKANQLKRNIINSLNDPLNPYSTTFYNYLLQTNYNVGIHYKDLEQGVPLLRTIKMTNKSLPLINSINFVKYKFSNKTYTEGFYRKKHFSENKKERSETPEKIINNNVLFKNYGKSTDYINKKFEISLKEESKEEKKLEKENLSEVDEEAF